MPSSPHSTSDTVRLRLMHSEEVYLYKIPPLTSAAAGHKAEDWQLAHPLQTCSLLVWELPDENKLQLEFFKQRPEGDSHSPPTLFCQSTIDLASDNSPKLPYFFEAVTDSSRYFVLRIQAPNGKEALIGFGFRERDEATDLREALQHYERTLRREKESSAAKLHTQSIPKLADGEKIHVNVSGSRPKKERVKAHTKPSGGGLLLKKPPPPGSPGAALTERDALQDETLRRTLKVEELDRLKIDDSAKAKLTLPSVLAEDDNDDHANAVGVCIADADANDDEFTDFQQG